VFGGTLNLTLSISLVPYSWFGCVYVRKVLVRSGSTVHALELGRLQRATFATTLDVATKILR